MSARNLMTCATALIAVALPPASMAAEPVPSATPLMERAFRIHEQGPDRLRQFVNRTRMIYRLNQEDVVKAYEATRKAEVPARAEDGRVASAQPDGR